MTAKQILAKGRGIDREINALIRTRDETKDRLTHITQNYDGDGAQSTKDPHKFDKLVELEDQINQMIDDLVYQEMLSLGLISLLDDSRERMILKLYYVDFLSWEQVAVSANLSWTHTMRLRKSALSKLDRFVK
jgi:DNA-directed RNA polymerase specialized sigma subunit